MLLDGFFIDLSYSFNTSLLVIHDIVISSLALRKGGILYCEPVSSAWASSLPKDIVLFWFDYDVIFKIVT